MQKAERRLILEPLREADIRSVVTQEPIMPRRTFDGQDNHSDLVFQMDIHDRATNFETLRIWPGHADNEVHITGKDRKLKQAVISVKEPERTFRMEQRIQTDGDLQRMLRNTNQRVRLISSRPAKYGKDVILEVTTPNVKRHFLVGKDERFYFIANCPRSPTTVQNAHWALRPRSAEQEGTERQGEWFFIPFTHREAEGMEELLRKAPIHHHTRLYDMRENMMRRSTALLQGDHTAENLYVDFRTNTQLAQGAISHHRHRKLLLRDWHKVKHNLEIENPFGIRWVD